MVGINQVAPPAQTAVPTRRHVGRRIVIATGIFIFAAAAFIFIHQVTATNSPVPAELHKDVSFPIYYPEQSKLPTGYNLDTSSFRLAQPGVLIYSVDVGSQRLVFSEEEAPDANIIDKFVSSYIPLHNTISTDLGKASIGAAGQGANLQTVVSLPITNGPWMIITAPANTKQSDIQQILQSIAK